MNKIDKFKNHLGYDGEKINEKKALEILNKIGVNATNDRGETPLIIAAYLERVEILKKILEESQNIDYNAQDKKTESALLNACDQRRLKSIKLLIEAGAELEQEDRFGLTPLSKIFTNTFSDPIPSAKYLFSKGAKITDKVIEMGISWNKEKFSSFLKANNFDINLLSNIKNTSSTKEKKTSISLDIERVHNVLNQKNHFETAKLIWQKLVPKSGQADTVQGELLRAIEKLRDEAQRNGNGNFNKNCHGLLIEYLRTHLTKEINFDNNMIESINNDLDKLTNGKNPYLDDDLYDRITKRIVEWYLLNPKQVSHLKNDKLSC